MNRGPALLSGSKSGRWARVGRALASSPMYSWPWEAVPPGRSSVFSRLKCGCCGLYPAQPPYARLPASGAGISLSVHILPHSSLLVPPCLGPFASCLPVLLLDQIPWVRAALSVQTSQPKWIKAFRRREEPAKKKILNKPNLELALFLKFFLSFFLARTLIWGRLSV